MVTLDEVPEAVQAVLVEFFAQQRNHLAGIQPEAVDVLEQFVLGGGKRLRPLFAWAGYTGVGGSEDPQAVLRAVSSLELIQACALIHDDIIDSSDTRRGRPTAHRTVETRHRERGWSGDSAHFGRSVAILLGDFALAWADDLVHSSGLSAAALQRVQEPWRAMRSEVIAGQLLDVSLEASGSEHLEDAERVNRFKTAAYTIERPLHIGAALADAPQPVVDAYRKFGADIGVAFQLRDDVLGVFGDPAVTGKPAGDDLREGKRTVLVASALALADAHNPTAAEALRRGIGTVKTPEEIAALTDIISATGARQVVEDRIAELTASGLAHLEEAQINPDVAEALRGLAIKATTRTM